ncbi:hypothetical protein SAMN05661096_01647 [Marivirga sericea]|uniref:TolB-like 6-blade propeller-like n=1 Tax=Marivirga sericea TaxID=1028 RepID=A0A1X7JJF3_9BACT|nr:hypothetical protein [Marivirga sericea]SMG27697.1 hypothetical protein SAMN05661096_01647 [Marivirga sericea]
MKYFLLVISGLVMLSSCGEEVIEFRPTEKFNSIFDSPAEGISFTPLDAIATDDGGFLVLSTLVDETIFVLKVTNRGDFQWSTQLDPQFVKAVPNLVRQGDNYYFIGSSLPDYTATLFEINDLEQTIAALRSYTAYRRPLAFNNLNPSTYLLLTYNDTTGTVLSKVQDGFAMEWARKYDDITNAHQKLKDFRNSNETHFFVGSYNAGSAIYFNSLKEDGMSLTYTNDQGMQTGLVSGSNKNMMNSLNSYGNGFLASNYVVNNQSFFINNYQPVLNDTVDLQNFSGEVIQDRLRIQNAISASFSLSNTEYLINAYSTLDGRVKLSFYDSLSGELLAIKYVGGTDPLEIIKMIPTRDEGLALLSKITIAGSKERINLRKIPKDEILMLL